MRSAWVVGLGALLAVAACSSEGGSDEKPTPSRRPDGIHYWTATPCSLLRGKTLVKGYKVDYTLDLADASTQMEYGTADGKQYAYQRTACTMHLVDAQQRIWNLDAAANIYEQAGPACSKHRVNEDLDAATASPDVIDDHAYRLPADKGSKPGRTLQMCNGNALFTITTQGPTGSRQAETQNILDQLNDRAADLLESGLRHRDA
ncbi:hypothetical protein AB0907_38590 [Streptomyces sp. NPDC006975]|uniref:hypothetical protein n=1 Tax=unclassified Streptomyces TaxID=2593676 RepID=UPI003451E19B